MHVARVAFQAPRVADDTRGRPLNVTLVLDASGSMQEFAELPSGSATTVFYELVLRDPARSNAAVLGDVDRWVDPRTGSTLAQRADVAGRVDAPFDAGDRSCASVRSWGWRPTVTARSRRRSRTPRSTSGASPLGAALGAGSAGRAARIARGLRRLPLPAGAAHGGRGGAGASLVLLRLRGLQPVAGARRLAGRARSAPPARRRRYPRAKGDARASRRGIRHALKRVSSMSTDVVLGGPR